MYVSKNDIDKCIMEDDNVRINDIMKRYTPSDRVLLKRIKVYTVCTDDAYTPHSFALSSFDYLQREKIMILKPMPYQKSHKKGISLDDALLMQMKRILMSDVLFVDNNHGYISNRMEDEIKFALNNGVKVKYVYAQETSPMYPIRDGSFIYDEYSGNYYLITGMKTCDNIGWSVGDYKNLSVIAFDNKGNPIMENEDDGILKNITMIYDVDNRWILDEHMNPEIMRHWSSLCAFINDNLANIISLINWKKYDEIYDIIKPYMRGE